MNRYKINSKEFFDRVHGHYGNSHLADAPVLNFIKAHNDAGKVLDLSCGDGRTIDNLFKNNIDLMITGVDISPKSIETAKQRNIKGVKFIVADVDLLPFRDNSFDVIYTINSFHHYPNPRQSLEEIFRVLKPGGKLLLIDICLIPVFRQIINLFLPFGHKGDYKIHSKKEILNMSKNAGLTMKYYKIINLSMFMSTFVK